MKASELSEMIEKVLIDPNGKLGGRLLGTYTYENNWQIPAITIGNPGNVVKAEGLEVVIPLMPATDEGGMSEEVDQVQRWDVLLVQRDPAPLQSPALPEAVERLSALFNFSFQGRVSGAFVDADTVLGSYPQYTFTFWADSARDTSTLVRKFQQGI